VIGEHKELMRWYEALGFTAGEVKRFAHLPFSVQYMARQVHCAQPGDREK